MKKLLISFLIVFSSIASYSNPLVTCDTVRVEGKLVLYLSLDHQYNGYYYGYLLGEKIMDVYENYVIQHAFGGASSYQAARQAFDQYFTVDQKYIDIAQGMITGMQDAGVSIYSPTLDEDLTYKDVLIANSIPDFTAFKGKLKIDGPGCSELTSWGTSTQNDAFLNGETVISRNLDWENHPILIDNHLITVWLNPEPNTQKIITIGFTGMIGALSGVNESGIATFQNMGNHVSNPQGTGFYPINLAQRNGLEAEDYNGDGECTPRDITDAVREHNVASSYIIHSAGSSSLDIPAEILEIHNSLGDSIRTQDLCDPFYPDNLVATNHHRILSDPVYCNRYRKICDSLDYSTVMNVERNWDVLTTAGQPNNLQTMQYTPQQEIIWLSYSTDDTPAYQIEPTQIYVDQLFTLVGIDYLYTWPETQLSVSPNPCEDFTRISLDAEKPGYFSCKILDAGGKLIKDFGRKYQASKNGSFRWNTSEIPAGIYYCISEFETGTENIKDSKKIVVIKQ